MELTAKQINEIAQELECGMKVFINRETLEYRTILDFDDPGDTEFWEDEMNKIEEEWNDYVTIEKPESRESFRFMADFVDEVEDEKLREDLIKILNRRSPFANFKAEIDESEYRQKWFEFRTKKFEEYVKDYLEAHEIAYEK